MAEVPFETARARTAMLRWLSHPATVLALIVLVVNDHVGKAWYPGLVTGKLSDVAGLVVTPPVLALGVSLVAARLTARQTALVALVTTGAAFAAVKALHSGAMIASAAWSAVTGPSVVIADRTDLLALPALGLSAWVASRVGRPVDVPRPPRTRPTSWLRRPDERTRRRIGVLVVLPAATMALAATTAPNYPDAVAVASWRSMIVAGERNAYHKGPVTARTWRASEDGGRTWRYLTSEERSAFGDERDGLDVRARSACTPGATGHCYRLVPGHLRVEETLDGGASWRTSWEVTDPQRKRLANAYQNLGDIEENLTSYALAVATVPGGHVVVVANRRDGYAVRDVTGRWERIGFGTHLLDDGATYGASVPPVDYRPSPASEPFAIVADVIAALIGGLLAIAIGAVLAARRHRQRWTVNGFTIAFAAGAVMASCALAARIPNVNIGILGGALLFGGLGVAPLLVGSLGALLAAATMGALRPGRAVLIGVTGFASSVVCAWLLTRLPDVLGGYRNAALLALATAIAGILLAGWIGLRAKPRLPITPDGDPPYPRPPAPPADGRYAGP